MTVAETIAAPPDVSVVRATDAVSGPSDPATAPAKPAAKPALPALTGIRALTAINILLFHFSDPHRFGPLAPVIDGGYASVSFFFLLSGYIMAYNYAGKAERGPLDKRRFWTARFARLYPVFFLSLLISWQMLMVEWHAQSHAMFAAGAILTPLMLQSWHPVLATFWSTPAWALSVEIFLYAIFPWLIRKRLPTQPRRVARWWMAAWAAGLVVPMAYCLIHPDGTAPPDRFSAGFWLRAVKFTPLPHVATFCCGILLARLQDVWRLSSRARIAMAVSGAAGVYGLLLFAMLTAQRFWTYPFLHDPLLVPFYALLILGLSGTHWLTRLIAHPFLVAIGEASYCLYILHFNMWQILHEDGVLAFLHVTRWDPWISYALIIAVSVAIFRWVEVPARKWIRQLAA